MNNTELIDVQINGAKPGSNPGSVSNELWYRINFAVDRAITFYNVKKQFEKDYVPGVGLVADAAKSSLEYFRVFGGVHSIPEFTTAA